jgi:hypothetical protein
MRPSADRYGVPLSTLHEYVAGTSMCCKQWLKQSTSRKNSIAQLECSKDRVPVASMCRKVSILECRNVREWSSCSGCALAVTFRHWQPVSEELLLGI